MEKELTEELRRGISELHDITILLRGQDGRPGIVDEHGHMKATLYGNGQMGLVQKMGIVWRVHVWVLCTLSGVAGSGITLMVHKFLV